MVLKPGFCFGNRVSSWDKTRFRGQKPRFDTLASPSIHMPQRSPAAASILVVDDEPIIRASLAEFLQQEQYEVQTASTGELALQMAARHKYDVVLCDVHLPGLDGLEVLERVNQLSPETFVLLITA